MSSDSKKFVNEYFLSTVYNSRQTLNNIEVNEYYENFENYLIGSKQLVVGMFKVGYCIAKRTDVFLSRIVRVLHKHLSMPILWKYAKRQLVKASHSLH